MDEEIHLLASQMAIHRDREVYTPVQYQTMDVGRLRSSSLFRTQIVCSKLKENKWSRKDHMNCDDQIPVGFFSNVYVSHMTNLLVPSINGSLKIATGLR